MALLILAEGSVLHRHPASFETRLREPLLRMRNIVHGIEKSPHPEEAPLRAVSKDAPPMSSPAPNEKC